MLKLLKKYGQISTLKIFVTESEHGNRHLQLHCITQMQYTMKTVKLEEKDRGYLMNSTGTTEKCFYGAKAFSFNNSLLTTGQISPTLLQCQYPNANANAQWQTQDLQIKFAHLNGIEQPTRCYLTAAEASVGFHAAVNRIHPFWI